MTALQKVLATPRAAWGVALGWLGLIYLSIPTAPLVMDRVKTLPHYSVGITLLLGGLAFLLLAYVFPWRTLSRGRWIALALLLLLYAVGFWIVPYPVERFHFLQYGTLSFLFARAAGHRFRRPAAFLIGFLLASFVGWMDEIIQGWLPNRYYSVDDIVLNVVCSALGLGWAWIFPAARPSAAHASAARPSATRPSAAPPCLSDEID